MASPEESIGELAQYVKRAVAPHLGEWRARRVIGIAASGDVTFDIDETAERAVEEYIRAADLNVAYYSEDRGLVRPFADREPSGILIIDPIDGTRGAIAGFEACVVSIAWADYTAEPRLKDVRVAALVEIKGNTTLTATRGEGVRIVNDMGEASQPQLAPTVDLESMAWGVELVGAPLDALFNAMRHLASQTTVRGGLFVLNSSAYELSRIVTGQLAAVVDVRNRLLRTRPELRDQFRQFGGGRLLSLYGYDLAAAALIVPEAGGVLTDAWGRSLDDWKLLDTTESNFGSLIAASNPELHARVLEAIDRGFAEA